MGTIAATVGVDLALANTGWCMFIGGHPALVGTITTSPQDTYARRALKLKLGLDEIHKLSLQYGIYQIPYFVEKSEWHQNLGNPNWKRQYAIEREVQFTQGVAHGVFYLWAGERSVQYYDLPVGEWHSEFGSSDKVEIGKMLATEFPAFFTFGERINKAGRKVAVVTNREGKVVRDHETDAAAIAYVGLNRLRKAH